MGKLSEFKNEEKKYNTQEEELKEKYDKYKNMNKQELDAALLQEVARQKQNGSFDYNALEGMVESLRGSLPENDYNNIKRILESLK